MKSSFSNKDSFIFKGKSRKRGKKMGMCSDCHYFLPNSEDLMSVENLRYAENLIFNKRIYIIINKNALSPLY